MLLIKKNRFRIQFTISEFLSVAIDVNNSAQHDVSDYTISIAPGYLQFWGETVSQARRQHPYERLTDALKEKHFRQRLENISQTRLGVSCRVITEFLQLTLQPREQRAKAWFTLKTQAQATVIRRRSNVFVLTKCTNDQYVAASAYVACACALSLVWTGPSVEQ